MGLIHPAPCRVKWQACVHDNLLNEILVLPMQHFQIEKPRNYRILRTGVWQNLFKGSSSPTLSIASFSPPSTHTFDAVLEVVRTGEGTKTHVISINRANDRHFSIPVNQCFLFSVAYKTTDPFRLPSPWDSKLSFLVSKGHRAFSQPWSLPLGNLGLLLTSSVIKTWRNDKRVYGGSLYEKGEGQCASENKGDC